MPIDANIAMGYRPPQFESPLGQAAQVAQLKQAQQQNMLGQMQMAEMGRAAEQKNQMRSILANADPSSPEINNLIRKAYVQSGDIAGLMAHDKTVAEAQAARAKISESEAKTAQAKAGTAKTEYDLTKQKIDHAWDSVSKSRDPDAFAASIKDALDKKLISQAEADKGLADLAKAVDLDTAQGGNQNFTKLRTDALVSLLPAKDRYETTQPKTDVGKLITERNRLAPNDPTRKLYDDAIKKATTQSPGTNVNVSLSTEKAYGGQFAGKVADSDIRMKDAADQAGDLAANANRISQILKSGQVFTGTGAELKLQLAKALKVAGNTENEAIANTEILISSLAKNTLTQIKSSGLGTGQGFTDKDLAFLNKAASGDITFDNRTLQLLSDLSYKTATASADRWNKRVKEIPKSAIEGTGISTEPISVPSREGDATRKPSAVQLKADAILNAKPSGGK
jgi:hypothetical protein